MYRVADSRYSSYQCRFSDGIEYTVYGWMFELARIRICCESSDSELTSFSRSERYTVGELLVVNDEKFIVRNSMRVILRILHI